MVERCSVASFCSTCKNSGKTTSSNVGTGLRYKLFRAGFHRTQRASDSIYCPSPEMLSTDRQTDRHVVGVSASHPTGGMLAETGFISRRESAPSVHHRFTRNVKDLRPMVWCTLHQTLQVARDFRAYRTESAGYERRTQKASSIGRAKLPARETRTAPERAIFSAATKPDLTTQRIASVVCMPIHSSHSDFGLD